jgi:hypothetical protein
MQYRLRTLLIVLALGPIVLAGIYLAGNALLELLVSSLDYES